MSDTPLKPNRLRPVIRAPAADASVRGKTWMIFERVPEACCRQCDAVVPVGDAQPLSSIPCPACGKKVLVPGRVGGFLLYAHIGEGEMGTIYRATDESIKRDVAVKLVRVCRADDPVSIERLRQEARAAGKVNHPRVAQVYALNFSNGHPYLVMELVAGEDLAQKLADGGALGERAVLRTALDVAEGLSALNREGLVHGDIKPSNIVLDRDGNAKLVDFGLSGMSRRDETGGLVGTPDYIPPELLQGGTDSHHGDLYSFGATLYHLLSGRPPFEGETPSDIIRARLTQRPPPLAAVAPGISYATCSLVASLLETDPAKRPENSEAVAAAIRQALVLLDTPAVPKPGFLRRAGTALSLVGRVFVPRAGGTRPRRPVVATVLLVGVAAAEILVAVRNESFQQTFAWLRQQARTPVRGWLTSVAGGAGGGSPTVNSTAGAAAVLVTDLPPPAATHVSATPAAVFERDASPVWESLDLGAAAKRGSTIQMGNALILQGTGVDMWRGFDRCRFGRTVVTGRYAISARVVSIADTHALALSGILLKGEDITQADGLFFGFLGNGELALQIRLPGNRTTVVRRSASPVARPAWLMVVRHSDTFEACVSGDGDAWLPFAACEMPLPPRNSVGFAVSANSREALATAKFADIRLRLPETAPAR